MIGFLDVNVKLNNGHELTTELHEKETDGCSTFTKLQATLLTLKISYPMVLLYETRGHAPTPMTLRKGKVTLNKDSNRYNRHDVRYQVQETDTSRIVRNR